MFWLIWEVDLLLHWRDLYYIHSLFLFWSITNQTNGKSNKNLLQLSHRFFPNVPQGKGLSFPVLHPFLYCLLIQLHKLEKKISCFFSKSYFQQCIIFFTSLMKMYRIWQYALVCEYYSPHFILSFDYGSHIHEMPLKLFPGCRGNSPESRGSTVTTRDLLKVSCVYVCGKKKCVQSHAK